MAAKMQIRGVTVDQLLGSILVGVNEVLPAGTSVVIDGVPYDQAGLQAKLEALIQPAKVVEDLRTQLATALAARRAAEPAKGDFVQKLVAALVYLFSADPSLLAKLGVHPRKPARALSAEETLARVTKARATRKLRHTMGSRQKAALKAQGEATITAVMPHQAGSAGGIKLVSGPNGAPKKAGNGATGPQQAGGLTTP